MGDVINLNSDFFEVLNIFPNLKEKLELNYFNLDNLKEGISIYDFLKEKDYSYDEIFIFIKKINYEIKYFLKNNKFPNTRKINIENYKK